jgi:uncharacterized NAD(P)/FAD-binding protein YdhS
MDASRRVIAIIGAGFCGTMMAVRLLRASDRSGYDVVLINRPSAAPGTASRSLARGLAYGTNSADHLLNVPAGRMSAFDEAPDDFANFLAASGLSSSSSAFVERRWYGDYLQATLKAAEAAAAQRERGARLTVVNATVEQIARTADGQYTLHLSTDQPGAMSRVEATAVVLALGNFVPGNPPITSATFYRDQRYLRDPWATGAFERVDFDRPILLVGTGLTMYDVVMSLKRRASAQGKTPRMIAISRRGLMPQPHRVSVDHTDFSDAPADLLAGSTVRHYLSSVRRQVRRVEAAGGDWRDVLASLRPITPAMWSQLPDVERRRFLRHLRPYWDSHRHRAAPSAATQISSMLASGELTTRAANLVSLTSLANAASVVIRPRGERELVELSVGTVINCTGPSSGLHAEPLLARLAADGEITADAIGLGLLVADDYRVLAPTGEANGRIFYVGPLLKAQHWEAVAVPELRGHVERAAKAVVDAITHLAR